MANDMALESCSIITASTKESGKAISNMAKAINCSATNLYTPAAMSMANLKDSVDFNGPMANSTKENGFQVADMAQACGMELRETAMSVSGNLAKLMVLECIYGSTEIDMTGISRNR